MDDIAKLTKDVYKQYQSDWRIAYKQFLKDLGFPLGDQWAASDLTILQNEQRPHFTINGCRKPLNVISGHERQARTDVKIYPIESSDTVISEIYTKAIKLQRTNNDSMMAESMAFKNSCNFGMGWVYIDQDFTEDLVNGDIRERHVRFDQMLVDPAFTVLDLSDAMRILRHAFVDKSRLAAAYPDKAEEIQSVASSTEVQFTVVPTQRFRSKSSINVVEHWYRDYEMRDLIINLTTGETYSFTKAQEAEKQALAMQMSQMEQRLQEREISVPIIKLAIIAENKIVLYDGLHPAGVNSYPYKLFAGFFEPSETRLEYRFQGITRDQEDPQQEKNKRRSQFAYQNLAQPRGGFMYEDGSLTDETQLTKPNIVMNLKIRPGKTGAITPITPPMVDQGLIALETAARSDLYETGLYQDMLGASSEKRTPGITMQLRQRQGMTAVQEFYDNKSFAMRIIGRYYIDLVNKWGVGKIQRILGEELTMPPDFEMRKQSVKLDCAVDETAASPTTRMNTMITLSEMGQNGTPVPLEILLPLSDIPEDTKRQQMEFLKSQSEANAKKEEEARQFEMQKLNLQLQIEQLRAQTALTTTAMKVEGKNNGPSQG